MNIRDLIFSAVTKKSYLDFSRGTENLIITAPHGGNMKPLSFPNRAYGNKGRDTYSKALTEKILELSEYMPYYIISEIHRSKIDLNRNKQEACQGSLKAIKIWEHWNNLLEDYKQEAVRIGGKALFVEIHSHNNSDEFQLGYNISAKTYRTVLHGGTPNEKTSLDALGEAHYWMLFGNYSLKHQLEKRGFNVLTPTNDKHYLNGGRNIEHYAGGGLGAIQIECPISVLRKDIDSVAYALTDAIYTFKSRFC